jgi:hypothetical protein
MTNKFNMVIPIPRDIHRDAVAHAEASGLAISDLVIRLLTHEIYNAEGPQQPGPSPLPCGPLVMSPTKLKRCRDSLRGVYTWASTNRPPTLRRFLSPLQTAAEEAIDTLDDFLCVWDAIKQLRLGSAQDSAVGWDSEDEGAAKEL